MFKTRSIEIYRLIIMVIIIIIAITILLDVLERNDDDGI